MLSEEYGFYPLDSIVPLKGVLKLNDNLVVTLENSLASVSRVSSFCIFTSVKETTKFYLSFNLSAEFQCKF